MAAFLAKVPALVAAGAVLPNPVKLWPGGLDAATPSVPYYIYEYSKNSADPDQVRLGWAAAFVLLVAVLVLNITTRLVAGTRAVAASRGD